MNIVLYLCVAWSCLDKFVFLSEPQLLHKTCQIFLCIEALFHPVAKDLLGTMPLKPPSNKIAFPLEYLQIK